MLGTGCVMENKDPCVGSSMAGFKLGFIPYFLNFSSTSIFILNLNVS